MSCFVMNPEPLAALANAIETRLNVGFDYWGFEAPDSLYRELADCKTSCTYYAAPIYRKLYALNVRAYNGRYSNHEGPADEQAPDVDISRYTITHRPEYRAHTFAVQPWHYQLAKLLDCYLYQTLEDTTYNDPLRLALAEFRDSLFGFIITRNPQYIALPWGALAAPYTPDKTGYHRSDEVEPLILEPDDWQPDEWATLCKLAGHLPPQETERIVISGYTLETFVRREETMPPSTGETKKRPIFHINTAAAEAAKKGRISYTDCFPHLKPGDSFVAWRVEDGFEVETTLDGAELLEMLKELDRREMEQNGI